MSEAAPGPRKKARFRVAISDRPLSLPCDLRLSETKCRAFFQLHTPGHAPCTMLYLVPMLIGRIGALESDVVTDLGLQVPGGARIPRAAPRLEHVRQLRHHFGPAFTIFDMPRARVSSHINPLCTVCHTLCRAYNCSGADRCFESDVVANFGL